MVQHSCGDLFVLGKAPVPLREESPVHILRRFFLSDCFVQRGKEVGLFRQFLLDQRWKLLVDADSPVQRFQPKHVAEEVLVALAVPHCLAQESPCELPHVYSSGLLVDGLEVTYLILCSG